MIDLKNLRPLSGRDRRALPIELCEIKFDEHAAAKGKPVQFEGYGSVWGRIDSYGDTVIKGAFTKSLADRRPMMFMGHNPRCVPGKWVSYAEDDKGLKMTGELTPGHSDASNLAASLKHGAMNGLSIGGYTTDWENQKDGGRIIKAFDLYEVSPVSLPAEQEARIDTASVKAMFDEAVASNLTLSDFEDFLRDVGGLSKAAATLAVSRFARVARGEPDGDTAVAKAIEDFQREMRATSAPNT